jgi:hypothetical protein
MANEIMLAAAWWSKQIKHIPVEQANLFRDNLAAVLQKKYKNHWHTDQPSKGSAFRSIIFDEVTIDAMLLEASRASFISNLAVRMVIPPTIMWVDPGTVSIQTKDSEPFVLCG